MKRERCQSFSFHLIIAYDVLQFFSIGLAHFLKQKLNTFSKQHGQTSKQGRAQTFWGTVALAKKLREWLLVNTNYSVIVTILERGYVVQVVSTSRRPRAKHYRHKCTKTNKKIMNNFADSTTVYYGSLFPPLNKNKNK